MGECSSEAPSFSEYSSQEAKPDEELKDLAAKTNCIRVSKIGSSEANMLKIEG
jgi:hypothetical protein